MPARVNAMAKITMFTRNTKDTALLLQPNSLMIGLNMTPKEYWAPVLKKSMMSEAATMYQP